MKKLCLLLLSVCCFLFLLTACGNACEHRDADDDSLCDHCGENYSDATDVTAPPVCQHRDADDNALCDTCGEAHSDGIDVLPQVHDHTYDAENTCTTCGHYKDSGVKFVMQVRSYAINDYTGNAEEVIIPSTYRGMPVTALKTQAFYQNETLKSISIPSTVTSISDYVLTSCSALESITVADGNRVYHSEGNCLIETATGTLVRGCNKSVIPTDGSVIAIGEKAFYGRKGLESLVIPDCVRHIGSGAFFGCENLKTVNIPEGITRIESFTFGGCRSLTAVTLPKSLTGIGDWAFASCRSLTAIVIPASVTSISCAPFSDCNALGRIVVEPGNAVYHSAGDCLIDTVKRTVIAGCKNSEIPTDGSVTAIGEEAFYGCDGLLSITIPATVTSIGDGAFGHCTELRSVTIPANVVYIGWNAFSYCQKLTAVTFVKTSGWYISERKNATNGRDIEEKKMKDTAWVADYLTDDYSDYYWHRS